MISLFAHNQIAYRSALSMLNDTGKAAVVHPTGTGKSFIGFKLAEDHPDASICWLSPSEYIFRTQMENLRATGAEVPDNILFFTYAKLMLMPEEELSAIRPSYIILDEFHRCGAQMWGGGVERLLAMYPQAPILGLSATNIRYLDNQRDMADELFDGNIASEMTLGEAIVRGILAPPTYVVSIYSCEKDLEKYQSRIKGAKTKAVRDEAQKRFDALRRALEKAEGLDIVFEKHMTDRHGKYLLFCSSVEHLNEIAAHVPQWFAKAAAGASGDAGLTDGANIHLYKAYADDPETSKAFAAFKADHSDALKLLLCIDMLNEGVHIDDIAGVILFRPTVSPIVYKQQIGRALSAGNNKKTVIIDVVNNIENLYSVSAIQEEMRSIIDCYRAAGDEDKVVNDSFTIIDEVKDSRRLFNELEESLSASWETMFGYAKAYYLEQGNLDIPKRYKTKEGYSLGSWLNTQRLVYAGKIPGVLGKERIQKLEQIGMSWKNRYDLSWERYYKALCAYKHQNGNIDVPANHVTPEGLDLGKWICNLRQAKSGRRRGYYLTDERIAALVKLGMIWDKLDYLWEQNYLACAEYYMRHHDLNIPANHASENGLRIGAWLRRMRKIRSGRLNGSAPLTKEQIARLDAIHMNWVDTRTRQWEYGYQQAVAHHKEFGTLDVAAGYVNKNGFPLGEWLRNHTGLNTKTGRTSIKVTPERRAKLDNLGFKWTVEDSWQKRIAACEEYLKGHGDLDVPANYVTDGIWLGKWLYECRRAYRGETEGKRLTKEQMRQLEELGMDWRTASERAWAERYETAARLFKTGSDTNAGQGGKTEERAKISQWIARQRTLHIQGKLTREQIEMLNTLNAAKTMRPRNSERGTV